MSFNEAYILTKHDRRALTSMLFAMTLIFREDKEKNKINVCIIIYLVYCLNSDIGRVDHGRVHADIRDMREL